MFCKWCGKKIRGYSAVCPHCGHEQAPLENGNGFWDLCDERPRAASEPADIMDVPTEKLTEKFTEKPVEHTEVRVKPTKSKIFPVVMAALFISILSLAAVVFSIFSTKGRLENVEEMNSELSSLVKSSSQQEIRNYSENQDTQDSQYDHEEITATTDEEDDYPTYPSDILSEDLGSPDWVEISRLELEDNRYGYFIKHKADDKMYFTNIRWQKKDANNEWQTVSKDYLYFADNTDGEIRAVFKIDYEQKLYYINSEEYYNPDNHHEDKIADKITCSAYNIGENKIVYYSLKIDENYSAQWQKAIYDNSHESWNTVYTGSEFFFELDEGFDYKLVLKDTHDYAVEYKSYSQDEEMNSKDESESTEDNEENETDEESEGMSSNTMEESSDIVDQEDESQPDAEHQDNQDESSEGYTETLNTYNLI